ncbi:unnamed protein product [Notodromas monacha]|uniref:Uncharacterized protein n=1 Tax=Notodromas monacha TaxID=399045 RepID=A0A7R9BVS9_9CRUS|nr:unnamed protein product [Notodromas monacha]CAG0921036.1 unnamed protein product [Notodromas monacha]
MSGHPANNLPVFPPVKDPSYAGSSHPFWETGTGSKKNRILLNGAILLKMDCQCVLQHLSQNARMYDHLLKIPTIAEGVAESIGKAFLNILQPKAHITCWRWEEHEILPMINEPENQREIQEQQLKEKLEQDRFFPCTGNIISVKNVSGVFGGLDLETMGTKDRIHDEEGTLKPGQQLLRQCTCNVHLNIADSLLFAPAAAGFVAQDLVLSCIWSMARITGKDPALYGLCPGRAPKWRADGTATDGIPPLGKHKHCVANGLCPCMPQALPALDGVGALGNPFAQ